MSNPADSMRSIMLLLEGNVASPDSFIEEDLDESDLDEGFLDKLKAKLGDVTAQQRLVYQKDAKALYNGWLKYAAKYEDQITDANFISLVAKYLKAQNYSTTAIKAGIGAVKEKGEITNLKGPPQGRGEVGASEPSQASDAPKRKSGNGVDDFHSGSAGAGPNKAAKASPEATGAKKQAPATTPATKPTKPPQASPKRPQRANNNVGTPTATPGSDNVSPAPSNNNSAKPSRPAKVAQSGAKQGQRRSGGKDAFLHRHEFSSQDFSLLNYLRDDFLDDSDPLNESVEMVQEEKLGKGVMTKLMYAVVVANAREVDDDDEAQNDNGGDASFGSSTQQAQSQNGSRQSNPGRQSNQGGSNQRQTGGSPPEDGNSSGMMAGAMSAAGKAVRSATRAMTSDGSGKKPELNINGGTSGILHDLQKSRHGGYTQDELDNIHRLVNSKNLSDIKDMKIRNALAALGYAFLRRAK